MGASEPAHVIDVWIKLFNSGDLDGLMSELYEDGAVLQAAPGTPSASGKEAVRAVIEGFLALKGTMSLLASETVVTGDLALCRDYWRLEVPGSDAMEGVTADVVRRQADGSWKYVIDNPFGGAPLAATA
jgi:ketosteroid isomerase-like protein